MNRQETITLIESLLSAWSDDLDSVAPAYAAEVFEQIPVTLAELSGPCTFEEAVRMASHDVMRNEDATA